MGGRILQRVCCHAHLVRGTCISKGLAVRRSLPVLPRDSHRTRLLHSGGDNERRALQHHNRCAARWFAVLEVESDRELLRGGHATGPRVLLDQTLELSDPLSVVVALVLGERHGASV